MIKETKVSKIEVGVEKARVFEEVFGAFNVFYFESSITITNSIVFRLISSNSIYRAGNSSSINKRFVLESDVNKGSRHYQLGHSMTG